VTDFARNKKALHDFDIEETYEAGIQLTGPEVKSVREGRANLKESYARVRDGEVFLIGAHISPYANQFGIHRDDVATAEQRSCGHLCS
jgi:SsrA-binding protein